VTKIKKVKKCFFFIYETNRPFGHRMGHTKRLTVVQMQRQQCHAAVPPAWCAPLTDATCCQPYIQQAPADDRRGSAPPPTPHAAARCEKKTAELIHTGTTQTGPSCRVWCGGVN